MACGQAVIGFIFAAISTYFVYEDWKLDKQFDFDVFLHFLELTISAISILMACGQDVIGFIFAVISTYFVYEDWKLDKQFDFDVFLHCLELTISAIGFIV